MKKVLMALMLMISFVSLSFAVQGLDVYSVSATTYPVTEATGVGALSAGISGEARIYQIFITNSSTSTAQTVTFYDNANSTTTVTTSWTLDLPSNGAGEQIGILFPIDARPWTVTDLAVRKSSTSSSVRVTLFYR